MRNIKGIVFLFMQVHVLAAHNWETYNEKKKRVFSLHPDPIRFVE